MKGKNPSRVYIELFQSCYSLEIKESDLPFCILEDVG